MNGRVHFKLIYREITAEKSKDPSSKGHVLGHSIHSSIFPFIDQLRGPGPYMAYQENDP